MVFELNKIAGRNGVGRIDMIEDRVVGLKSREVYECPGSVTLVEAHKALERLVLTRDELRLKAGLDQKYAELIYDALWSSPLRGALDAFNAKLAERLTGEVRVKLIRGRAVVTGARSPFALYDESLATYGAGDTFRHDAAGGFIQIHGLPVAAGAAKAAEAAERADAGIRVKRLTSRRSAMYVYSLMSITAITLRRPPPGRPVRFVPGLVFMR